MSPSKRRTKGKNAQDVITAQEMALPTNDDRQASGARSTAQDADDVQRRIRERAYEIYQTRADDGGTAFEDWIRAEQEIVSEGATLRDATLPASENVNANESRPNSAR